MRSALRQLVLAERELRPKPPLGAERSERLQTIVTRQAEPTARATATEPPVAFSSRPGGGAPP
jgi:hypothetical protein